MSSWAKKVFWKTVTVEDVEDGFTVKLDGRNLKTPAKAALVLPTREMANAVAAEWEAQVDEINPLSMPTTRSANASIDKVAIQHAEVADMLAEYGGTDLLCYRATSPEELIDRQAQQWDPVLDWCAETLEARLKPVSGVMFVSQDSDALNRLRARVHEMTNFELAAFHDLVSLSGSLILGFAATHQMRPIEDIWTLSRLDESWQEELWGEDEEAVKQAEIKKEAFLHADRFYKMSRK